MKTLLIAVSLLAISANAFPYPHPDEGFVPVPVYGASPPSYEAGPVGRVKMQVYRGPSDGKGYDVFAPWGFYVTQPHDAVLPAYH